MGKLFGTDGIRGIANEDLSCELSLKVARASAQVLMRRFHKKPKVIIGQDTRESGNMIGFAMASGFTSAGADVVMLGVVPTPAVAYLVRKYNADIGVVISASHNPSKFNGIKLFNGDGYKLLDEIEDEIENCIFSGDIVPAEQIGNISFCDTAAKDYVDFLLSSVEEKDFSSLKIVVDCANGASYITAKPLFEALGANAEIIFDNPNGKNINDGCGSTHLDKLAKRVVEGGYDIGIAFDGDADRCLAVDEQGNILDGDRVIAALAVDLKQRNKLTGNKVVVTTMTNMGFNKAMEKEGIEVVATKVGDRYVLEEMLKQGLSVGGEQSGHLILLDINTTGDGQLTALALLSYLIRTKQKASYVTELVTPYPQVLMNVKADRDEKEFLNEDVEFNSVIDDAKITLGKNGRVVIRPSGTEPLVRVMVEGADLDIVTQLANTIAKTAEKRIAEK
ncbi:MAG: phosphoglucosamine mutase [Ruminococcaceae bacterium]|nr:phosphoglucosamine mutase [Oscillospiraceae bacterium]